MASANPVIPAEAGISSQGWRDCSDTYACYNRGMTTMEERVSKLEGAYEQVDQRLRDLTEAVGALRHEMNTKFNTLIVIMSTVGVAIAGAILTLALRL